MATRTITRRLEFDAGHRLINHEGKCKHLHGHHYCAEITCSAAGLDAVGRIIDFSEVKRIVGGWIDTNWDHNIVLNAEDPLASMWMKRDDAGQGGDQDICVDEVFLKPPYIMQCNPTAENMAEELYKAVSGLLPSYIAITRIQLYETPNGWADYVP